MGGTFVGRERELAAIGRLLASVRLLTLTGPPGVGKSRLALEAATAAGAHFPDGVAYVSLAAARDPGLLLPTIAQVLGVWERVDRPLLDSLRDAVGQKRLLLLLDNFDPLASATDAVAAALAACPGLTALVTSRAILHAAEEHVYPVPPLALPAAEEARSAAAARRSDAVRLFVDRARAAQPGFALDDANAAAVAALCRRLDGLPLAIELAAARAGELVGGESLGRLAERLSAADGDVAAASAQGALRDTIAWSADLLPPAEKALFRRLGVFVGRFSARAAVAVAAGSEGSVETLVDRSLLQRETAGGEPYFRLLETIRAVALERLAAGGDAEEARERHAAYYLALAEELEPRLDGPAGATWLDRLEAEHANLRAAMRRLIERGDAERALRVGGALCRLWSRRGYFRVARALVGAALALPGGGPARVKALAGAAAIAYGQGDYAAARVWRQEQLAVERAAGNRAGVAAALMSLALPLREQGDYAAAQARLEEAAALYRALGDRRGLAYALDRLGTVAQATGDLAAARARYDEALGLASAVGDRGLLGWVPHNLGRLALQEGRLAEASGSLHAGLQVQAERGDQFGSLHALAAFAALAAAEGRWERALRLSGSTAALADASGSAIQPTEHAAFERWLAVARLAVGEERAHAALAKGRETPLERALGYALADAD